MSGASRVVEAEFMIRSSLGLHARPAGRFVTLAGGFSSEITVGRDGEWVSGCSVLSILSLAAGPGTVLRVRAEGSDAETAVRELGVLLEEVDAQPDGPASPQAAPKGA